MNEFALLIQGPLTSKGAPGKHLHLAGGENLKKVSVSYDCRDNVKNIISKHGSLFKHTIVSTWENEINSNEKFSNTEIVTQNDPGALSLDWDGKLNNKNRQFIGMNAGLEFLQNLGFDGYVLKIRTDTNLDIDQIINHFNSLTQKDRDNKIGVPIIISHQCYIQDSYFIGTINNILNFSMSQTSYTEFTNSVHNETILKYAYRHYREQINFENLAFFPAYFKPLAFSETLKISEFMSKHAFFSLPEEIFYNQIQRGSKISQKFAEKIHNSKKQFFRETNSKFLSCDYTAYRRIAGIKVQSNFFHRIVIFTNKVMIKFTKFGFVRYRLLRRQIRKIIPIS